MKNWEAFMGGFLEFRDGKRGWKEDDKGTKRGRKTGGKRIERGAAARRALGAGAFAVHNGLSLKNLRFDYA
jgi:hypothetical protein